MSRGADRVKPVGAVDGVLLATGQRQRASTYGVSWRTARDDVRQPRVIAPDLFRGCPGRVDVLSVHFSAALPLFAGPANSNRIMDRPAVPEDVVECLSSDRCETGLLGP